MSPAPRASWFARLRHGGQIPLPDSFVDAAWYLSKAPFCDGFVSSQDSSSKACPLKKACASLMWHFSTAATRLPWFLPTVHSHFRVSLFVGTKPASSESDVMIIAPPDESQNVAPYCASRESELFLSANSVDSSAWAKVICALLQIPEVNTLLSALSSLSWQALLLGGLWPSHNSSLNVFWANRADACLQ